MIELKKISQTISKAYDVHPKFAEDMNRTLEGYAEYYYKIFEKENKEFLKIIDERERELRELENTISDKLC